MLVRPLAFLLSILVTPCALAQGGDCNGNCILDVHEIANDPSLDVAHPLGGGLGCGPNGVIDACEGLAPTGLPITISATIGQLSGPFDLLGGQQPPDIEPDGVIVVTGPQHGSAEPIGAALIWFRPTTTNCWTRDGFTYRYARRIPSCFDQFGEPIRVWSAPIRVEVVVLPPTGISDCNGNCQDDSQENLTDCDGNSVPDVCQIAQSPALDCDLNGQLDACQAFGPDDSDFDGIVDLCQPRSLELDAASPLPGHVRVTDTAALRLNTLTLEAWVWLETGTSAPSTILARWGDAGVDDRSYALGIESNGEIQFSLSRTDTQQDAAFHDFRAGSIAPGAWRHVAATYDGITRRIYVDGILRGERATTGPVHPGTTDLAFGVTLRNDATGAIADPLHGRLDEVRIWSHARTETQIRAAMPLRIRSAQHLPGLVGVWPLDHSVAPAVGAHSGAYLGVGPSFLAGAPIPPSAPCCEPTGFDCTTTLVSAAVGGLPGNDNSGSAGSNFLGPDAQPAVAVSRDGAWIAFASSASNLVAGDTTMGKDLYLRAASGGAPVRVALGTSGQSWTSGSPAELGVALDADGDVVAFDSTADGVVACDTNRFRDVFVLDRGSGLFSIVSRDANGVLGNNNSERPALSGDGRLVAFESWASNLVTGDTNARKDVFLVDRVLGTITCVSRIGATHGNDSSSEAVISEDGNYVAFSSAATNLAGGDTNSASDVFRRRPDGTIDLVSAPAGGPAFRASRGPSISATGRFVAFSSTRSDLVPGDVNGDIEDIFVRDMDLSLTYLVSRSSAGHHANWWSSHPSISADGRFVAFTSAATNLVPDDTNGQADVFVHDRLTGETRRLSLTSAGTQGTYASGGVALSGDGLLAAFTSSAPELSAQSLVGQIVVRSCTQIAPFPVCIGDGTDVACPCGNNGAPQSGCENSFGTGGARLTGAGSTRVSYDRLRLELSGLPPTGQSPTFFQGRLLVNVPFGDGVRCAGGTILRLGTRFTATGAVSFGHGVPGDPSIAVQGLVPWMGTTRWYQVSYRNSVPFCTPQTFNLSNAVEVHWAP